MQILESATTQGLKRFRYGLLARQSRSGRFLGGLGAFDCGAMDCSERIDFLGGSDFHIEEHAAVVTDFEVVSGIQADGMTDWEVQVTGTADAIADGSNALLAAGAHAIMVAKDGSGDQGAGICHFLGQRLADSHTVIIQGIHFAFESNYFAESFNHSLGIVHGNSLSASVVPCWRATS